MKNLTVFASYILIFILASATFYVAAKGLKPSAQETNRIEVPVPNQAKLVLVAPTSARIGELVHLDVSESNATEFRWLLVPDSVDFLVYDSGRRAVFSGRKAGEFQVIVGCAVDGTIDVVSHIIRVIGPPEKPVDGNLVDLIHYWMWDVDLPPEDREALADSFESIAAQVDTLLTPKDWIEATAKANRTVLGDRIDVWSVMLGKIGDELLRKAQAGELTTPEEHQKVWLDIAKGLRAC